MTTCLVSPRLPAAAVLPLALFCQPAMAQDFPLEIENCGAVLTSALSPEVFGVGAHVAPSAHNGRLQIPFLTETT